MRTLSFSQAIYFSASCQSKHTAGQCGGSWSNLPNFVRSAARSRSGRNSGEYDYSSLTGFRVARDLP